MRRILPALAVAVAAVTTACSRGPDAESTNAAALAEQVALAETLASQKDSLTRIVLETDRFLAAIDSQLDRAPGLKAKAPIDATESPMAQQLAERQQLLARVQELVDRSRATSAQLTRARQRIKSMEGDAAKKAAENDAIIRELGSTIQRQLATIGELQMRVDSLATQNVALQADTARLRGEVRGLSDVNARAWVVVGTERELLDMGIIVREGGANLLVARVGRTLSPARDLPQDSFTAIDIRTTREIALPDSTKRYMVVSRHSLDYTEVANRDGNRFGGAMLRITDAARFWENSRYLILVEQ
jgi:regulator of replication initiation timing